MSSSHLRKNNDDLVKKLELAAKQLTGNELPITTPEKRAKVGIFNDEYTTPAKDKDGNYIEPVITPAKEVKEKEPLKRKEPEDVDDNDPDMQISSKSARTVKGKETGLDPWDGYLQNFPNSVVFKHKKILVGRLKYVANGPPRPFTINITDLATTDTQSDTLFNYTGLTWVKYCQARWDYYHVMGCKIRLTVFPYNGATLPEQYNLYIEQEAGNDNIPTTDLLTPTAVNLKSRDYTLMGIYPKAILSPVYTLQSVGTSPPATTLMNYKNKLEEPYVYEHLYKPGSYHRNIVDDDSAQIWTSKTSSPLLQERVKVWILPSEVFEAAFTLSDEKTMLYHLEMEYLTQWKDLNNSYKYQRNGLSEFQ